MKRSSLEQKLSVLRNVVVKPKPVTHLMRACNLKYVAIKRLIGELEDAGLLVSCYARKGYDRLYSATGEGKEAVRFYGKLLFALNRGKPSTEKNGET